MVAIVTRHRVSPRQCHHSAAGSGRFSSWLLDPTKPTGKSARPWTLWWTRPRQSPAWRSTTVHPATPQPSSAISHCPRRRGQKKHSFKYLYIQQTPLPGFRRKKKNWAFRLKALGCGYLNTGQLDVVRYKPGKTVTHEEDHHVPPERDEPLRNH